MEGALRTESEVSKDEAVADYRLAFRSRMASVMGQREVVAGRAKFGIFGDGKEVPQVALAREFRAGDWRCGYYRDQTVMLAAGVLDLAKFFAQLYGDPDLAHEPASGGRQMNNQLATRFVDAEGRFTDQLAGPNSASGFGPVAFQMASALGLAYASKLYRDEPGMRAAAAGFSDAGNEVVFASIGNASAAEGIFWESVNAAAVLQVPMVLSVWDDGYGISVPNELQMAKSSVSTALSGLRGTEDAPGFDIHTVPGWDYPQLRWTYRQAVERARRDHVPVLVHVTELTQPQGHSTSGSHERYKARDRLEWELEHDCLARVRTWLLTTGLAERAELEEIEAAERELVTRERDESWERFTGPIKAERGRLAGLLRRLGQDQLGAELAGGELSRRTVAVTAARARYALRGTPDPELDSFLAEARAQGRRMYRTHLYSETGESPLNVPEVPPEYADGGEQIDGRLILVRYFDQLLSRDPRVFVVGEDVGRLGDVNLVYEGLQAKHGSLRLTDTGIREATILGQGIGAAMRGLRPLVDIQYLDYFKFAQEVAADDLATLRHRTAGGQKAPVVIRTKGHRLVGMTHSGSPMAEILSSCRGIWLCVPRDMTRAAGMYNTLFRGDDPGLVIEVLNAYRLKERVPLNLADFTVPLGVPEVLREGSDVTVVTYGALCRIALEAAQTLSRLGVEIEVVDAQTLNPFDRLGRIADSVRKTGAIVCLDEDVPGGASAFMLREILEVHGAYGDLDSAPKTITAAASRPAYAADGDYFSKPGHEEIVEGVYGIMRERRPAAFPPL